MGTCQAGVRAPFGGQGTPGRLADTIYFTTIELRPAVLLGVLGLEGSCPGLFQHGGPAIRVNECVQVA